MNKMIGRMVTRKKALLVGARFPCHGPWINLEEGEWLVEPPLSGRAAIVVDKVEVELVSDPVTVIGPVRIHGIVLEGEVYLDAKKVA